MSSHFPASWTATLLPSKSDLTDFLLAKLNVRSIVTRSCVSEDHKGHHLGHYAQIIEAWLSSCHPI